MVESFLSNSRPPLSVASVTVDPVSVPSASALLAHNDLVFLTHRETADLATLAIAVDALDAQILKVFEADKTPKPFATLCDLEVCVQRIEGLAVGVGEANAVILDVEADDLRQTAIEFDLTATLRADLHSAVLPARLVYGLNTVDDHLDDGRVNGRVRPDVLDRPFDIDVAHASGSPTEAAPV